MSVIIVGTVGIDDIATPTGQATRVLGGSATYAALAARLFAPTALVSVVGTDFPQAHRQTLEERGIDLDGLDVAQGRTFRWGGRYHDDLNTRDTEFVELNVVADFTPRMPSADVGFVFVGNIEPRVQLSVLGQIDPQSFVLTDSMDHWIRDHTPALEDVFRRSSMIVLNDQEVRMFSREPRVPRAVVPILELGPKAVAVKMGEYGAVLASEGDWFFAPGYPLPDVVDPTGAGDAFAGAMIGSLAEAGDLSGPALRRAIVYGSVAASFTVEAFGVERLAALTRRDVEARYAEFKEFVAF